MSVGNVLFPHLCRRQVKVGQPDFHTDGVWLVVPARNVTMFDKTDRKARHLCTIYPRFP